MSVIEEINQQAQFEQKQQQRSYEVLQNEKVCQSKCGLKACLLMTTQNNNYYKQLKCLLFINGWLLCQMYTSV